ncbi:MBL fold metallo-hydrolase [Isoptericola halotolerans]|uniref:L-ascorbate metabolism protein UlaG (Beta-lactamase superfamily) n=1 Tax=Isoptericola halotolerans TaxID=300560 RepID=A0ABX2A8A8_9MICO|nr:MBL fold metallo-hydrolase [Isoptericola halotolerans]NOV98027.1 L-ascorbate metabolism protein UlaG (beta-lactamase superfamily) [Isoptericola halotolerans]
MLLTFHGHACVALDGGGARLVIDPGTLADSVSALVGATAILVTHEHPDHLDVESAVGAMRADELLTAHGTAGVLSMLAAAGAPPTRLHEVTPGQELRFGDARVAVGGGDHAPIHPRVPQVENRSFTVGMGDRTAHHPGDSFDLPAGGIDVLCLPVSGPWLRLAEAMDAAQAASARTVVPVHDALLSEVGHELVRRWLDTARLGGEYAYRPLDVGESLEV